MDFYSPICCVKYLLNFNNQFSYNIDTSIYNELKGKYNDIKTNIEIFHGNFRFEENGEYYSLMGSDYGYFTIKKKDLDEEKKDFTLQKTKPTINNFLTKLKIT